MARAPSNASFELVEEKRAEMGFFLERLSEALHHDFAFRCYFSAFASAAMSVLYSLEAAKRRIDPQFECWYEPRRKQLVETDPVTRYVLSRRQSAVHWGETAVRSWRLRRDDGGQMQPEFFFAMTPGRPEPLAMDVLTACEHTHNEVRDLVEAVREAFPRATRDFLLDEEVMRSDGLAVEDVEERLGFPTGWSYLEGATDAQRLAAMRRASPPIVAHPGYELVLARFEEMGGWEPPEHEAAAG